MKKNISKLPSRKKIYKADKYLTKVVITAKRDTLTLKTFNERLEELVENENTRRGVINNPCLRVLESSCLRDYIKHTRLLGKVTDIKTALENDIKDLESSECYREVCGVKFDTTQIIEEYVIELKEILEKLNQRVLECYDLLANKYKVELDKLGKMIDGNF